MARFSDASTPVVGGADPRRRVPTQARSRRRVESILDAAAGVVLRDGVEAVTTRSIAADAQMPVASLYQYFADKEAVLLAIAERDMAEMTHQVQVDLDAYHLKTATMTGIVRTVLNAYIKVLNRRPAFVEIYLRGRTNAAVMDYVREHIVAQAAALQELGLAFNLLKPDIPPAALRLAIEIGDRVLQVAYESDQSGDAQILTDGVEVITSYLNRFTVPPSDWQSRGTTTAK